jgi:hypothetical protein
MHISVTAQGAQLADVAPLVTELERLRDAVPSISAVTVKYGSTSNAQTIEVEKLSDITERLRGEYEAAGIEFASDEAFELAIEKRVPASAFPARAPEAEDESPAPFKKAEVAEIAAAL